MTTGVSSVFRDPYTLGQAYTSDDQTPQDTAAAESIHNLATPAVCTESAAWSGDSLESRMAVMVLNHATESRQTASEQRDAEEKNIASFEAEQIHQMHRSAELYRKQAVADLALGVSSAVISTGAALGGTDNALGALGTGVAKTLDAGKNYVDTAFKDRQKRVEIKQTEAGNSAEAAKRRLEDVRENKKAADELASRALNFYTTTVQLEGDGERAAIFRG